MDKWLDAEQATGQLAIKRQTLYANVSRGRIRSRPDPDDSRKRQYHAGDVARLANRRAGRHTVATLAAESIRWGAPLLPSSLSTVVQGRLHYRGRDAVSFARLATFEQVCAWLWSVDRFDWPAIEPGILPSPAAEGTALHRALTRLAHFAGQGRTMVGRPRGQLIDDATHCVSATANAVLGLPDGCREPMHLRLVQAWSAPHAAELFRQTLVLMADHELNASTFATRVAASTGPPLSAALLAGLATLAGPRHGGASAAYRQLVAAAARVGPSQAVDDWLSRARTLPAFGHPLYPAGDPRAIALLGSFEVPGVHEAVRAEVKTRTGEAPNVDFALAAMTDALRLPNDAPLILFAIGRLAGWVAHALEQIESGDLIRPRAHYTGETPQPAPPHAPPRVASAWHPDTNEH